MSDVITPESSPEHHTVGRNFRAWCQGKGAVAFYCDSYDPDRGYWMTNTADPGDRRCVSERAIGRTYHRVWEDGYCADD